MAAFAIGGIVLTGGYIFLIGSFPRVLIPDPIQIYIDSAGNPLIRWPAIVIGSLLFVFITLQQAIGGLATARHGRTPGAISP
jgi:ribose/xylose/arabinose/galactoside ABC-type transport system permease subunit